MILGSGVLPAICSQGLVMTDETTFTPKDDPNALESTSPPQPEGAESTPLASSEPEAPVPPDATVESYPEAEENEQQQVENAAGEESAAEELFEEELPAEESVNKEFSDEEGQGVEPEPVAASTDDNLDSAATPTEDEGDKDLADKFDALIADRLTDGSASEADDFADDGPDPFQLAAQEEAAAAEEEQVEEEEDELEEEEFEEEAEAPEPVAEKPQVEEEADSSEEPEPEPEPEEPANPNWAWYIVKVQSGREETIKNAIERRVKIDGLEEYFDQIVVPTEKETVIQKGKRVVREKKKFPGYIAVHVEFNDQILYLFRETSGVGDFVGGAPNKPPIPMTPKEVADMVGVDKGDEDGEGPQREVESPFHLGDHVKVKDGMFKDLDGEVKEIMKDKAQVRVEVVVLGRPVNVELEYWQVEEWSASERED